MILLNIRVMADPLISELDFSAALAHPSQKLTSKVRITVIALSFCQKAVNLCEGFIRYREHARRAANRSTCQLIAVFRHEITRNHRAHAMTVKKIWKIRVDFTCYFLHAVFVLHHGVAAFVAPVSPSVVFQSGFAVSDMVVSRNDVACLHKSDNHVEISAGVFAEAMNQLNNSLRLACRYINPPVNGIALVKRFKFRFM